MTTVGSDIQATTLAPSAHDGKPGSVIKAHQELQDALSVSHKLLDELVTKLQPVLNTTAAEKSESRPSDAPAYGSPAAGWIVDQTRHVNELNAKLSLITELVDI